ncbi:hypothetical protein [Phascolarctobacterium succinatutens]|uniref:hypothetical protein n=1 Tax=Phascolarctobacterium succinatutens TaxID=626940 RepID=UPI003AB15A8E
MFFAGLFCKRLLKKFIFILKLALANYQPILALFYKRVCKIFNIVLQGFYFTPSPPPSTPFLQEIFATCCIFSSKFALQRQTIRQNAKAPGAGQACFEGNQTEMPKRTALFF